MTVGSEEIGLRRRKKRIIDQISHDVELNIMPFIDVFSLLCTFLLFTAVFVSIGIHVVQIPFLSNSSEKSDDDKTRMLSVTVDSDLDAVTLTTKWSRPPTQETKTKFPRTKEGLDQVHSELVRIRIANSETDKLTLFIDDAIKYADVIVLLDTIRLRKETDPVIPASKDRPSDNLVFPKVVLGSVML